jgi:lipopolysaccharide export system permease protein
MNSIELTPKRRRRGLPLAVIDRMVSGDLLKTVFSILLVLVVIIVSKKFLGMLTQAIDGEVSADTLFRLLGLRTLSATTVLIPPATFMAVLTVMGRMYRDHEMAILASAGVGTLRLYKSLSWLIIPLLLFSSFMSLEVMPWTEQQSQALQKRDKETADIRGIKPGRFNEFSSGDVVLYAEEMTENKVLHNIFVQSRQGTMTGVVVADRGHLQKSETGDDFMVLNEGRRYQGTPGQMDYTISDFEEYGVRIGGPEEEGEAQKREAEDTIQLIQSRSPRELAELQKRLAVPLGVGALALLAVPLARVAPRSGPYGSIFSAFLIYIIYENAQKISQGMLMAEKIPPWLAYTAIYGLLIIMTLSLLLKNLGPRWIRHQLGVKQP